jgi:uncharacterized protein (TIGR02145 family)
MRYYSIIMLGFILSACNKKDTDTTIPAPAPVVNTSPSHLNPNLTYGSVTDIDGNTYATIVIGTQEWMAENLRTTRYSNGDSIPYIADGAEWQSLRTGAITQYENDSLFSSVYGMLYNWWASVDSRNICPQGWHMPSNDEWNILIDTLGGQSIAGGKMKSLALWDTPFPGAINEIGTNESGFSGIPGGYRLYGYGGLGQYGMWWCTREVNNNRANERRLTFGQLEIRNNTTSYKTDGLSCRCIKD